MLPPKVSDRQKNCSYLQHSVMKFDHSNNFDLWYYGQVNSLYAIIEWKITVDTSKYLAIITVTKKKVRNVLNEVFLLKLVYFDLQNPTSVSISVCLDRITSIIHKKLFLLIIENTRYGSRVLLWQAEIGRSEAPSTLHCVPHCLQSVLMRCQKLHFGLEKLFNSTYLRLKVIIQWNLSVIGPKKLILRIKIHNPR